MTPNTHDDRRSLRLIAGAAIVVLVLFAIAVAPGAANAARGRRATMPLAGMARNGRNTVAVDPDASIGPKSDFASVCHLTICGSGTLASPRLSAASGGL